MMKFLLDRGWSLDKIVHGSGHGPMGSFSVVFHNFRMTPSMPPYSCWHGDREKERMEEE